MKTHQVKRRRRVAGIVVILTTTAAIAFATDRPDTDPVVLQGKLDERIQLVSGWRYHPGDNPMWSDPELDDSGWAVAFSIMPGTADPPGGWPGIGWFRRRLELAGGMPATALAVRPEQNGASEMYLDGRLVARFGVVSADPALERPVYPNDFVGIALQPGRRHVLAIRYSNSHGNVYIGRARGFALNMRSVESAAASYNRWAYLVLTTPAAFAGAFAALAVLHLLLFAFHRREHEHLVFAAFSVTVSALFVLQISIHLTTDLITRLSILRPYIALNIVSVILGLALVHTVVRRRPTFPTWFLCAAGAGLVAWVWTWQAFRPMTAVLVFLLIAYLEMLRVAVAAVRRREADMWIVAVAFVPLAGVAAARFATQLLGNKLDLGLLSDATLVVLALAFSVFISRRAGRTARELEQRLAEVHELSERAVENERRAVHEEAERRLLEAENLRRTRELEAARRLQLAMLPHTPPQVEGFELAFHMVTATEVGGDYVDLRAGDGAPPLFAVGDATSHGLQAGMVVAVAKSLFQGVDPADGPLAALRRVGGGLKSMQERHASMAMVIIQVAPSLLRVASAGMPPVLVLRHASGTVDEILVPGVPLGTLADASYSLQEVPVATGDIILVATDGLAEAMGVDGAPFGYERIAAELRRLAGRSAQEVVDGMLAAATGFLGAEPPQDDITLVAMVAH
ncbi:MAG: SpoIIE family protein phosphatase [Acidobacteria bacterium]|nr:SpoIIE family protein phosphatase [Acidobacteriota bacterium]